MRAASSRGQKAKSVCFLFGWLDVLDLWVFFFLVGFFLGVRRTLFGCVVLGYFVMFSGFWMAFLSGMFKLLVFHWL